MARDLLLHTAHGIDPGRRTQDVDIALMVPDWQAFASIRNRLIETGAFAAMGHAVHRLLFKGGLPIDLIPFGAIESASRHIAWPPDGHTVMSVFGFAEAMLNTIEVRLPRNQRMNVVSLPALAVLKLLAWRERRYEQPGKDAHDLHTVISHYLDAGNRQRLYTDAAPLLDTHDFDYELAGAYLLGHDMARVLSADGHAAMADLLFNESDPNGPARLAGDMPGEARAALALLDGLAKGFGARSRT